MLIEMDKQTTILICYCCLVTKSRLTLKPHGLYIAHQAPLSMRFPRQENWSGLPFSSPGNLPDPGMELTSPALAGDSLPLSYQNSRNWILLLFKFSNGSQSDSKKKPTSLESLISHCPVTAFIVIYDFLFP